MKFQMFKLVLEKAEEPEIKLPTSSAAALLTSVTTMTNDVILGSQEYSGEGNGTPLQYSCLENPMDGGAW